MRIAVLFAAALLIPAAAVADTTWVSIGSPANLNSIPFWGSTSDAYRCQWLYNQGEINQAGDIVAIGLYSSSDAPAEFYHVTVTCCHTPLTELTTNFSANYGGKSPQIVLQAETLLVGTGVDNTWYYFPGTFNYNDTDNLIVEITWRGDAGADDRFYRNGNGSAYRRCSAASDTASIGNIDNVMGDYIRFGFLQTGVEELKDRGLSNVKVGTTIARGLLFLPPSSGVERPASSALLDISGRRVLDLHPGANDVGRLSPGIYFLRGAKSQATKEVVVTE
ncbi:MAG TPA: hypothetical protein VMH22_13050 [bacterium]|nr:hypothetical protein [bacterium]